MGQPDQPYRIFTIDGGRKHYLAVSSNGNDDVVAVGSSDFDDRQLWYKVTADKKKKPQQRQQQPSFVLKNKTKPLSALVVKIIPPRKQDPHERLQVVLGRPGQDGEPWTMAPAGGGLCYIQRASDPNLVFHADNTTSGTGIIVKLLEKRDSRASNPKPSSCWKIVPASDLIPPCPAGGAQLSSSDKPPTHLPADPAQPTTVPKPTADNAASMSTSARTTRLKTRRVPEIKEAKVSRR